MLEGRTQLRRRVFRVCSIHISSGESVAGSSDDHILFSARRPTRGAGAIWKVTTVMKVTSARIKSHSQVPGRLGLTVLLGAVALILSACGSDVSEKSSGDKVDVGGYESAAKAAMQKVTTFTGPTDGPAAQPAKSIVWISCGDTGEGCRVPGVAAKKAAAALGWTIKVVDGKFDPTVYSRAIQEAINDRVDGIVIDAISSEVVAEPVKKARASGIVVGSYDSANTPSDDGVNFEVLAQAEAQGKAMADYMIWKTAGEANAFTLNAPEFKGPSTWLKSAQDAIADCGSCKVVTSQKFGPADAASRLPQLTAATLRQNPTINVVLASYDSAMLQTIPALAQAGTLERVKVGTFNGTSPALALIRKKQLTATVGGAMGWGAWATLDNMNRVFAGDKPVEQNVPIRLIAAENVDTVPAGVPWDGDTDYAAEYTKIWAAK